MSETSPSSACRPCGFFGNPFLILLLLFVAGAIVSRVLPPRGGATAPIPLPPLLVEGWLNTAEGAPPSRESLLGRHVVLESWATWCAPCRAKMPKMAELYGRWADREVAFVGLTNETADKSQVVADYVASVPGFDWPVGYGANMIMDQLGVEFIPWIVLFGPDGRAVWSGDDLKALERELERRVGG